MPYSPPVAQAFAHRRVARFTAILTALFIAAAAFVAGAGPAKADTRGNVSHVWFDANEDPDYDAQARYLAFIRSLRDASGHIYRGNVEITQADAGDRVPGLIRADINMVPRGQGARTTLRLWISPGNLYLRGFTTQTGVTYQVADSGFNLQSTMNALRNTSGGGLLPPANAEYRTLGFDGSYTSIGRVGGVSRSQQRYNYTELWNHLYQMAFVRDARYSPDSTVTARSFLTMIQFTSEAARLHDVFGVMNDVVSHRDANYNGMPDLQQSLENAWSRISSFGIELTNGTNPAPVRVNNDVTLTNWQGVARYAAVVLSYGSKG